MPRLRWSLALAAAVLLVVLAFGAGYWLGREARVPALAASADEAAARVSMYTADGYTGADVASFRVGDTWYGFRSSVAWRDRAGSEHSSGWPDCLPKLQSVHDVRFAGTVLRYNGTGSATVVWVDCQQ
jgi:hypothetical protein